MPGLIETNMGATKKKNALGQDIFEATPVGYDPAQRTVDAATETVSGQLDRILSKGSPLLQGAQTRAAQAANRRGLINSSMAVEAGEKALIDTALPIAGADAGVYGTAARENMAAKNSAFQFGAGESNIASRFNADSANQIGRMGFGAELEKGLIGARTGAEKELIGARTGAESTLQQQRATQELARLAAAGDVEAKLQLERSIQAQAQQRLQGEIQAGLIQSQEQSDARLRELQGEIEKQLIGSRTAAESQLLGQRTMAEKELTTLRGQIETQLQTLRGNQAQNLANIEANFRGLIQANASATGLYQDSVRMIAAVMSDVNTSTEQKQAAVDKLSQMLESGLTLVGGIANIDIAGLLNFTA